MPQHVHDPSVAGGAPTAAGSPSAWTDGGLPDADAPLRIAHEAGLQRDLRRVVARVQGLLVGRTVLEVGCGDGWWTARIAQSAASVVAVDDRPEALSAAAARRLPAAKVRFQRGGGEGLDRIAGTFEAGFTAFPCVGPADNPCRATLLGRLHARLGPGALVALVDCRDAGAGDAVAAEAALRARVRATAPDARALRLEMGERLWCLSYIL